MKEVLEAIERHLGRSLTIPELDYYQVIGLELYCDDPKQIRNALQEATNRWMQSETGKFPDSAQIVGKLLKQAQAILLDPQKRERYNAQLSKLRTSQKEPASAAAQVGASDQYSFPDADPMAPFAPDPQAWQARLTEAPCALLEQVLDPQTRLLELEQLFPTLAEWDAPPQTTKHPEIFVKQNDAPKSSRTTGVSLAEQMRLNRRRKKMLVGGGMVLAALLLLGASVWAFINNQHRIANKEAFKPTRPAESLNGGAPMLPEVEKSPVKTDDENAEPMPPTRPRRDRKREKNQEPVMSDLPSVPRDPVEGEPPNNPPANTPLASTPTAMVPSTNMPETPPETPPPSASSSETAEWKKMMATARASIDRADFATFETEIAKAIESAQSPMGRDQAARLDQLGQLYKIATESFEEAKRKARGTSSLKVGNTETSIVETTPEKLIVRVAGKNQPYTWDKLPFGIAAALTDLSLSSTEPTDLAARAIYFSLAPAFRESAAKSDLLKKRIDDWFEKSLGKGQVRADLRQALTDSYE
ncbi:MAG: hypothetical protein MUF23_02570 [Pirellula sp.]|nr:hypothetical protein [Pirellula sp.]